MAEARICLHRNRSDNQRKEDKEALEVGTPWQAWEGPAWLPSSLLGITGGPGEVGH